MEKFYRKKSTDTSVSSVIKNLNHLLNTRKGFGSFLRRLGIGDWNMYRARNKIIETILEEIKENIQLYEPRVRVMDIKEVESDVSFRLRFELKCEILSKDKPIYVIFDSVLNDIAIEEGF